ncbi:MAG: endonuclease [Anaerolineae bacterium]|nr:endonuclease [Anaerolineae bacterium]
MGDVLYSFRYRAALPSSIRETAPTGKMWVIRSEGRATYAFVLISEVSIVPDSSLSEIKLPDATPSLVAKYSGNDEQALLAKLRYNRLIDIFTGVTCYSLQSHLRTSVPSIGQVETDELYVGVDQHGVHYIFPVQVKRRSEQIGVVQIEQDYALCKHYFSDLICRPIAAQLIGENTIALFELQVSEEAVSIVSEKHYRLVQATAINSDDLNEYRRQT